MARFAALITFDGDRERRLAARPRHREYLKRLLDEGKLHESGPWADDSGALIVYEAGDEAEVRALMAADPYAEAGAFARVELKEWNCVLP